jgi:hypothetical protein
MKGITFEKLGGLSIIIGSALFAIYSLMFPLLLPLNGGHFDMVQLVLNPHWIWLALVAFIGILLMLVGFYAVYMRIRNDAGTLGALGFLFIEAAYLLQACKVIWELVLYPIIASQPASAFLLGDLIIKHDSGMVAFRIIASITILMGIVLFCFTLYRSRAYPKLAPLLIFTGALVYALGPLLSVFAAVAGIFVLASGCALLGLRLLSPGRLIQSRPRD